jgi:hypothetical protein
VIASKGMAELTREFFQKQGARGGKMGGGISWSKMTPEERSARAKKAVDAREKKRALAKRAAAAKKKKTKPAAPAKNK